MKGHVMIGTSNIVLPVPQKHFPPEYRDQSRLHYCSVLFNSLEVNSSFYKIPQPATFRRWAEETTDGFRFTVKIFKGITHEKALAYRPEDVVGFMAAANELGTKKGCLLLQFPGKINFEYYGQVETLLQQLRSKQLTKGWDIAMEFRHPDWYAGETYEMLHAHKAVLVLHDKTRSALMEPHPRQSFLYLRYHGPAGDYRGSYTDAFLQQQADLIKAWGQRKRVYAYFNNTLGAALDNALTLRSLLNS